MKRVELEVKRGCPFPLVRAFVPFFLGLSKQDLEPSSPDGAISVLCAFCRRCNTVGSGSEALSPFKGLVVLFAASHLHEHFLFTVS